MAQGEYAVVLDQSIRLEPAVVAGVADAIVAVLGGSRIDAATRIRRAGAILLEAVDRESADRLVDELAARGIVAGTADVTTLQMMGQPVAVRAADCTQSSLNVKPRPEESLLIDWGEIAMVAVCPHRPNEPQKEHRNPMGTKPGIMLRNMGMLGKAVHSYLQSQMKGPQNRAAEPVLVGDLFVLRPPMIVRILSNRCSYGSLGGQATGGATRNFRSLIAEVARLAPQAELTPITRQFLQNDPVDRWVIDDMKRLDNYHRWLFLRTLGMVN